MAIKYRPKVGEILECDFGNFADPKDSHRDKINGRIPPEMVKKRMVVVLNGKLHDSCVVTPISSTKDLAGIHNGLHVPLESTHFRVTSFYDQRERWAKSELTQLVSKDRLFKMRDQSDVFDLYLPFDQVTLIQVAIIKAISATKLLT